MSKLTALPVVTSLDAADLVYAVDVSDTTDDPAGSSVAITKANLVAGGGGTTVFEQTLEPTALAEGDVWFEGDPNEPADPSYASVYGILNFEEGNGATTLVNEGGAGSFTSNNGSVTTAYSKFGTGSWTATANNAAMRLENPPAIGVADFTIEFFGSPKTANQTGGRLFQSVDGDLFAAINLGTNGTTATSGLILYSSTTGSSYNAVAGVTVLASTVVDQWYHIAIQRISGTMYMFVDGVVVHTWAYASSFVSHPQWIFCGQTVGTSRNTGWALDAVRITEDVGRYDIAGFTPPVAPYPTQVAAVVSSTNIAGSDLAWNPVVASLSPSTVVKEEIGRITDPGTGGFDFTGLSLAGYDRVYIEGIALSAGVTGTNDSLMVELNGDTTAANYWHSNHYFQDVSTGNLEGNTNKLHAIANATGPGVPGSVNAVIEFPGGAQRKFISSQSDFYEIQNSRITGITGVVYHDSLTAAITQITLVSGTAASLTGTLILYGERTL